MENENFAQEEMLPDEIEVLKDKIEEAKEKILAEASQPHPMEDMLKALAIKLDGQFEEAARERKEIEDRWKEDLRQYQGRYESGEASRFDKKDHKGSRAFANITRPKTQSYYSKMSDILFPTDDVNFALKLNKLSTQDQDIARAAMRRMDDTIREQLLESNHASVSRDVLRDGAIFGTGIKKAPVLSNKVDKMWVPLGEGVHELRITERETPDEYCVRPWNYFPDMSASRKRDCEYEFERQYLTRKALQDLAKLSCIIQPQMQEVLKTKPGDEVDEFEQAMRQEVSELESKKGGKKYVLKMYHGPILKNDLLASGQYTEEELEDSEEVVMGEVWFIGNFVIKVAVNPLDSGESQYSVWSPEKDDSSVFGYGIPYLLRHPQKIRNSTMRMMLDNAGMSVGPQIVIDKNAITPADGEWKITPNKVWYKKRGDTPVANAFQTYHITNNQSDISAIYKISRELADEETNMPLASQTNEGANVMASKTGVMSMVMNAQNVTLRAGVKNWDDDMTIPTIRRYYEWNMQFNPDPQIKCDCKIYAKGSSELLLKETQAANIGNLVSMATSEVFAPMTNFQGLYRQVIKTMQYDPDTVLLSEAEQQRNAENAQGKGPSPEQVEMAVKQEEIAVSREKLQLQARIHQDKMAMQQQNLEMRIRLAEVEKEKLIVQLMTQKDISAKQAEAMLAGKQLDAENKRVLEADKVKAKIALPPGYFPG
jgi:hypothetical protein